MSDPQRRPPQPGRPYTGETLVMPKRERGNPPRSPASPDDPPFPPGVPPARRPAARPVRRRIWPRVRLALLALLALFVLGVGLFYWQVHTVAQAIVVPEVRNNPSLASPLILGANVLLVGVDERPDNPQEGVRSDTLMLLHLDAAGRWASMLSIPRDTQVELDGIGTTKINTAYYQGYLRAEDFYGSGVSPRQGGMAFAAQTVEDFLMLRQRGLRVDYVAQINFAGFAGVIDALGGITIDVPRLIIDEEYPTEDFQTMRVEFQPGPQRMDGKTALIYARTRHADSDFGRAERQQQVIRAIVEELRAKGWAGRVAALPGVLRSVQGQEGAEPPLVTTFPIDRPDVLLGLIGLAAGVDPASINQVRLSPETAPVAEIGTNLVWEPAGVRALVDQFLTKPTEAAEQAVVQVFNGTQSSGLAGRISGELDAVGFRIITADNAPPGEYPRTIVYDRNNKPRTSRRVADTLNAERVVGPPPAEIASNADIVVVVGADKAGP